MEINEDSDQQVTTRASSDETADDRPNSSNRIGQEERSGSITALGVLLGFSITILSGWSNRPEDDWNFVSLVPLALFGISVGLQVVALNRMLPLPRVTHAVHNTAIKLAVIGLLLMFVGFLSTIVIDVVCGVRQCR